MTGSAARTPRDATADGPDTAEVQAARRRVLADEVAAYERHPRGPRPWRRRRPAVDELTRERAAEYLRRLAAERAGGA